jgi:hypothetical protein
MRCATRRAKLAAVRAESLHPSPTAELPRTGRTPRRATSQGRSRKCATISSTPGSSSSRSRRRRCGAGCSDSHRISRICRRSGRQRKGIPLSLSISASIPAPIGTRRSSRRRSSWRRRSTTGRSPGPARGGGRGNHYGLPNGGITGAWYPAGPRLVLNFFASRVPEKKLAFVRLFLV